MYKFRKVPLLTPLKWGMIINHTLININDTAKRPIGRFFVLHHIFGLKKTKYYVKYIARIIIKEKNEGGIHD